MSFAARCKTQADAIAHLRAETNYVSGAVAPVQTKKVYHKKNLLEALAQLVLRCCQSVNRQKHGLRRP